ncbi:MAG: hypothetical protein VKI83_05105 [Synechococcaceae cyanobacterium]|nr:hypothetical protein [Synechococcaceae cyanobacterium]
MRPASKRGGEDRISDDAAAKVVTLVPVWARARPDATVRGRRLHTPMRLRQRLPLQPPGSLTPLLPVTPVCRAARIATVAAKVATAAAIAAAVLSPPARAARCTDLQPIGGDGSTTVVTKRIDPPKVTPIGLLVGRTNWNTDFIVPRPFASYRFFFTADSSERASYPIEGFLKFSDGTNLRVINETVSPKIGGTRQWGPFPAIPGKTVSQLNFKIGTADNMAATGFSYRISTQGCD